MAIITAASARTRKASATTATATSTRIRRCLLTLLLIGTYLYGAVFLKFIFNQHHHFSYSSVAGDAGISGPSSLLLSSSSSSSSSSASSSSRIVQDNSNEQQQQRTLERLFSHVDKEVTTERIRVLEEKLLSRRGPNGAPRFLFLHRHDEQNIGDLVATPQLYFDFFRKVNYTIMDIGGKDDFCSSQRNFVRVAHQYDAIIVGGGGLIGCVPAWDGTLSLAAKHPASFFWAAGINKVFQTSQLPVDAEQSGGAAAALPLPAYLHDFSLYGVRDELFLRTSPEHMVRQLDDVTCMSPLFDEAYALMSMPSKYIRVAVFEHKQYPINPVIPCSHGSNQVDCEAGGCVWDTTVTVQTSGRSTSSSSPFCRFNTTHKSNNGSDGGMDDIVAFLAQADVVVTSSYHGLWWATLLGKRVVIHRDNAINTKQFLFGYPPVLLTDDLARDIENARVYDDALDRCRRQNRHFYLELLELVDEGFRDGSLPPKADFLDPFYKVEDNEDSCMTVQTSGRCGASGLHLRKKKNPNTAKLQGRRAKTT